VEVEDLMDVEAVVLVVHVVFDLMLQHPLIYYLVQQQ
jgi:hypothetical protein